MREGILRPVNVFASRANPMTVRNTPGGQVWCDLPAQLVLKDTGRLVIYGHGVVSGMVRRVKTDAM